MFDCGMLEMIESLLSIHLSYPSYELSHRILTPRIMNSRMKLLFRTLGGQAMWEPPRKIQSNIHGPKWVWVNTYRYIFSGMNIHLPAILRFTRGTRFWPIPKWHWNSLSARIEPRTLWILRILKWHQWHRNFYFTSNKQTLYTYI